MASPLACSVPLPQRGAEITRWQKCLCYNREEMKGTAFGTIVDEQACFFLFLWASQSPLEVWFLRMRMNNQVLPILQSLSREDRLALCDNYYLHSFDIEHGSYCNQAALPFHDEEQILVLENLAIKGDRVVSDAHPIALCEWLQGWPDRALSTQATIG